MDPERQEQISDADLEDPDRIAWDEINASPFPAQWIEDFVTSLRNARSEVRRLQDENTELRAIQDDLGIEPPGLSDDEIARLRATIENEIYHHDPDAMAALAEVIDHLRPRLVNYWRRRCLEAETWNARLIVKNDELAMLLLRGVADRQALESAEEGPS